MGLTQSSPAVNNKGIEPKSLSEVRDTLKLLPGPNRRLLISFPFAYNYTSRRTKLPPQHNDETAPIDTSNLSLELLFACSAGNLNRVQKILESGANPKNHIVTTGSSRVHQHSHPLFEAIRSGNLALVKYLIEKRHVDVFKDTVARDTEDSRRSSRIHKYDALCFAIAAKQVADPLMLEYLIGIAAKHDVLDQPVAEYRYESETYDPNQNVYGYLSQTLIDMTYLHYAAWVRNPVAFSLLVRYGADLNRKCSQTEKESGVSPLELFPEMLGVLSMDKVKQETGSKMLQCATYSDVLIVCQSKNT